MKIEGYDHCRSCEALTPTAVLRRSNGWCGECIRKGRAPAIRRLKVGRQTVSLPRKRYGSRGSVETVRLRRNAEQAAMRRLKNACPANSSTSRRPLS